MCSLEYDPFFCLNVGFFFCLSVGLQCSEGAYIIKLNASIDTY